MTDKPDQRYAEVHIVEDYDTGETTILLRVFNNQKLEAACVLDSLGVYEKTTSSTKWKAMEKEND